MSSRPIICPKVRPAPLERPGRDTEPKGAIRCRPKLPLTRAQRVAIPEHPGIFRRGSSYVVPYRDRGKWRSRAFRTLTEAKRFKGRTDSGDTRPDSREPFNRYAKRWLDTYPGRTAKGLSDGHEGVLPRCHRAASDPVLRDHPARAH